jgi:hypothetical protein
MSITYQDYEIDSVVDDLITMRDLLDPNILKLEWETRKKGSVTKMYKEGRLKKDINRIIESLHNNGRWKGDS